MMEILHGIFYLMVSSYRKNVYLLIFYTFFTAFGTSQKSFDEQDLGRSIGYKYAQVKGAIERDWSGNYIPVSLLDKQFLRLTEETLDDNVLMNEKVVIEGNGPVLENDLTDVPARFGKKLDFHQLLASRIMKCKFLHPIRICSVF